MGDPLDTQLVTEPGAPEIASSGATPLASPFGGGCPEAPAVEPVSAMMVEAEAPGVVESAPQVEEDRERGLETSRVEMTGPPSSAVPQPVKAVSKADDTPKWISGVTGYEIPRRIGEQVLAAAVNFKVVKGDVTKALPWLQQLCNRLFRKSTQRQT